MTGSDGVAVIHEPHTSTADRARPVPDLVVIGASAGGLNALTRTLRNLPPSFPAAIVVVQHIDPRRRSLFPQILTRALLLPVREAVAGDELTRGVVAMAAPDKHLVLDRDDRLRFSLADRVRFLRPSVDYLFSSVAAHHGPRSIAIILSGTGSDGASGVLAIQQSGGTVIVEDPATAEFSGMPAAAVAIGAADFILSVDDIGAQLMALVGGDPSPRDDGH